MVSIVLIKDVEATWLDPKNECSRLECVDGNRVETDLTEFCDCLWVGKTFNAGIIVPIFIFRKFV